MSNTYYEIVVSIILFLFVYWAQRITKRSPDYSKPVKDKFKRVLMYAVLIEGSIYLIIFAVLILLALVLDQKRYFEFFPIVAIVMNVAVCFLGAILLTAGLGCSYFLKNTEPGAVISRFGIFLALPAPILFPATLLLYLCVDALIKIE